MKKQMKAFPIITVSFLSAFFLFSFGFIQKAEALTLAPARIEVGGDPGETISGEIEVINEENVQKTFYTSYENFEPRGDSGAPYFVGGDKGLATWIDTAPTLSIKGGERKFVPYTITIPKNAEPGGYFSAIFFGSSPANSAGEGQVSIGGRIGSLVLLRVNGEIEEGGGLVEFSAKDGKRIFTTLPVELFYRFNNTGGDRVVPKGEIKFKNTLRITTDSISANEKDGSVLPNSTRKIEAIWGNPQDENMGFFSHAMRQLKDFSFGWYTAKLEIVWGDTAQVAKASYNFFVFPWQLLVLVAILGLIIYFGIKRYNKFIVSMAMKNING